MSLLTETLGPRVVLAYRIYTIFFVVFLRLRIRRLELPRMVKLVGRHSEIRLPRGNPAKLGRAIHRSLSVGRLQPRCLTLSMVHYTLLARLGLDPVLVIGLPRTDTSDAHAWVEVAGRDVGPPPGQDGSIELARFGGG